MDNFNYREFIYGQSLFNGKEDDKHQLNESAPGYDTRKFGEALPTLESVKAAHEAKEKEEINENQDDSYYIDEIKRDLEELDDKEANEYLEELAKSILKLKR